MRVTPQAIALQSIGGQASLDKVCRYTDSVPISRIPNTATLLPSVVMEFVMRRPAHISLDHLNRRAIGNDLPEV